MPPRTRTARQDELTPEGAVRLYLEYLANPSSFDNQAQVESLRAQATQTTDVIEKLALLRDARQAEHGAGEQFKAAFVRHAMAYAREHGYTAEDFRALGVSPRTLTEAGFSARGRRVASSSRSRSGSGRSREELADVRAWAAANGLKVSDRGRIAHSVVEAYEQAHR